MLILLLILTVELLSILFLLYYFISIKYLSSKKFKYWFIFRTNLAHWFWLPWWMFLIFGAEGALYENNSRINEIVICTSKCCSTFNAHLQFAANIWKYIEWLPIFIINNYCIKLIVFGSKMFWFLFIPSMLPTKKLNK